MSSSFKNVSICCPKCGHTFSVKDLDDSRPVFYCNKCDKGYVNNLITKMYYEGISYGEKSGKEKIQKIIKEALFEDIK